MSHVIYRISVSFMLNLNEFDKLLAEVGHGDHRWSYTLAGELDDIEDGFITLTYTNPIYGSLPNAVSYQFPVFCSSTRNTRESTYVCLHPELAKSVRRGLYFQEDKVLWDMVYDWVGFWSPMEALLAGLEGRAAAEEGAGEYPSGSPMKPNGRDSTPPFPRRSISSSRTVPREEYSMVAKAGPRYAKLSCA